MTKRRATSRDSIKTLQSKSTKTGGPMQDEQGDPRLVPKKGRFAGRAVRATLWNRIEIARAWEKLDPASRATLAAKLGTTTQTFDRLASGATKSGAALIPVMEALGLDPNHAGHEHPLVDLLQKLWPISSPERLERIAAYLKSQTARAHRSNALREELRKEEENDDPPPDEFDHESSDA